MSFEPCQNCGKPVSQRGLCHSCSAAVNDATEAVELVATILGDCLYGDSKRPAGASCFTCKHSDKPSTKHPCKSCYWGDGHEPEVNHWEAAVQN